MISKVSLILSTIRHLKLTQVKYQIFYRLFKPKGLEYYGKNYTGDNICRLAFIRTPPVLSSYKLLNKFEFLNLSVDFRESIDWDFQENGKLWNYNLQYCNYILQEDVPLKERISLLESLYIDLSSGRLPLEPYPASLRTINIIHLLSSSNAINLNWLQKKLYCELDFISNRLEYHLLGNHLLENAFALLMGGGYFSIGRWMNKAEVILRKELDEQILSDGAHFELSPMYHQIILFRLLECIDWYRQYPQKKLTFLVFLEGKAELMLSWLNHMTFANGDIPHFNDSSPGIAYQTKWLNDYSKDLDLNPSKIITLSESGYRVYKNSSFQCIVDVAEIGPSYQPGHGHADALSFIMYVKGAPFLIEQGTSTYQIGIRRNLERSTEAHNTVSVLDKNQSEVWGGFRVGNRARVNVITENKTYLKASHNGYSDFGATHTREFIFEMDSLKIIDSISGGICQNTFAYYHFTPGVKIELVDQVIHVSNGCEIKFNGASDISIEEFDLAIGFNNYEKSLRLKVAFGSRLVTEISTS